MYRINALLAVIVTCVTVALPHSAPANLLADPGFESGAPWTLWGDAHIETWAKHAGANGLAFYGWGTGGGAYQDILANGASNYTFSMLGFRDNEFTVGGVVLKMEFFNAAGTLLMTTSASVWVSESTNTWTLYSVAGTSPANTVRVRPVLAFSGPAGTAGGFKWDDGSLTSDPVSAGTVYVSPDGGNIPPFTNWANAARTIQDAISVCASGSTVVVTNGTYLITSNIVVDRAITLRSVNGATGTVVNAQHLSRVFYLATNDVTLDGFTICNGEVTPVASNAFGAGVYMPYGGTIRNSSITSNHVSGYMPEYGMGYAKGAGIYCAVTGLIENCLVSQNTAEGGKSSGGGIFASGAITITNCTICTNRCIGGVQFMYYGQGGSGGGIFAEGGVLIESCRISNNLAQAQSSMYGGVAYGAGVYAVDSTLRRCLIRDNLAISGNYPSRGDSGAAGAGAYLMHGRMENCLVAGNCATGIYMYADAFGGGVLSGFTSVVVNCTIVLNTAAAGHNADYKGGGGIYSSSNDVYANTIICFNTCYPGSDANVLGGLATYTRCCAAPRLPGTGNIDADPRLVNPATGDAHLLADSPCIDRGTSADGTAPSEDIEGTLRPLDGNSDGIPQHDIGAYEAPAGTTTPNLLLNGTFENPSAWTFIDDAHLEGWAARSGTNGLAMYGWTDGGLLWQDVPAAGVSNYTFTAWGFRDADFAPALAVEMKIEFLSASYLPLATTQRFVTGSAAWASFSISGISPPDAEIVRVVLAFAGPAGSGGAFKWDDAVLLSSEATFSAHYVAAGGGHIYPFTNWAGAATNLQAAIDAAESADTILVSNGTYMGETVVNKSLNIRGLGDVRLTGKAAYPFTDQKRALSVNAGCLLDLRNVTIMNGYNQQGGGIYNQGTLVLKDSAVISNEANLISGDGGGIYNAGTATIERCSISLNRAQGEGTPGSGTGYGAGIFCANGSVLVITDSALVGNRAYGTGNYNGRDGGSAYGGAIYNDGGTVTLISTTLATNSAAGAWAGYNGGSGYGGAIYTKGPVTLLSCTLADNRAQQGGATMGGPYVGEGGGIYLADGASAVTIRNTILAGNTASTVGPDCRGWLNAVGRNLVQNIADCAIVGETENVIIGADPLLAGVGMNGGPTPTCALLFGSPAIDQGSGDGVPSTDQRGAARPIDGDFNGTPQFDIGAFEYDPQAADSDGDSLSDYSEVMIHHSNPTQSDSDNDGMGDGSEIRAGTDPTNSASLFDMETETSTEWNGEGIVVRWQSAPGKQYEILRSTNLASGFSVIASDVIATEPVNTSTDTTATAEGPYFYKIRVE